MWSLRRQRHPSADQIAQEARSVRQRLVMRALQDVAGIPNGVVYDVPRALKPEPRTGQFFFRGSSAWRSYLDAREQVDSGEPAVIISLRVLDDVERHLVVDWGTTYANCFLLIEPSDWRCDLSEPLNAFAQRLDAVASATLLDAPEDWETQEDWTRTTRLGALLRELFGTWVYWTAPLPHGTTEQVSLRLYHEDDTLWSRLLVELVERFPQSTFDYALADLHAHERELFGGPVPRARSAFRTRLGLPIMRDAHCVDRALRRLVNEGRMTIVAASLPGRPAFGPGRPVPESITDEEFAQFFMA